MKNIYNQVQKHMINLTQHNQSQVINQKPLCSITIKFTFKFTMITTAVRHIAPASQNESMFPLSAPALDKNAKGNKDISEDSRRADTIHDQKTNDYKTIKPNEYYNIQHQCENAKVNTYREIFILHTSLI